MSVPTCTRTHLAETLPGIELIDGTSFEHAGNFSLARANVEALLFHDEPEV
ncbi:hypothetical protein [Pseudokineococcus sp. 1T1Z-3]|uniref:hypothetical protein n=1 Tax=Pseudokineococcus sp. 1T1Z-3 TaxID=3132745 RepID=UPI0030A91CF8